MRLLTIPVVLALAGSAGTARGPAQPTPKLADVQRIWGLAPHNAFTDLIRFKGRWYCVFREGLARDSADGVLRILTSADAEHWVSAALISSPRGELREPKLSLTPDGRLMLNAGAGFPHTQSLAWLSFDGRNWRDAVEVGEPGVWLWRVTWQRGMAYGIGYTATGRQFSRLYVSREGLKYDAMVENLFQGGLSSEGSLLFLEDDTALCLLRRDEKGAHSVLGRSRPPYRAWEWKDLGLRLGGASLLRLEDGRIVAAGSLDNGDGRTALCWLDPQAGLLKPFLVLPSGGDSGGPGMALYDGLLWVSYHSSHEGKTSIYLAKVKLDGN
jgi:hypothetical protein